MSLKNKIFFSGNIKFSDTGFFKAKLLCYIYKALKEYILLTCIYKEKQPCSASNLFFFSTHIIPCAITVVLFNFKGKHLYSGLSECILKRRLNRQMLKGFYQQMCLCVVWKIASIQLQRLFRALKYTEFWRKV